MLGPPTVAEVVDLVVRMEDDPSRRDALEGAPFEFFKVAHDEGLIAWDGMSGFANVVGEAVRRGLLGFRSEMGGAVLPPPEVPWTDHAFQSRFGYYSTVDGQQMAALHRQRRVPVEAGLTGPDEADEPVGDVREHWRSQVALVFELPAPSSFPVLDQRLDAEGVRILRRYAKQVEELADSAVLSTADLGYTVRFGRGVSRIDASLPSSELVRGVALIFRQLYAPDERASFAAAMRVLQTAVRGEESAGTQAQLDQLSVWGKAAVKLRSDWLEALVFERGQVEGTLPAVLRAPVPAHTPEQILSAFFYGEYIHWDRGAEQIEAWSADPFSDTHYRFFFLSAVAQLSAVYIPFGEVVAAALGGQSPEG